MHVWAGYRVVVAARRVTARVCQLMRPRAATRPCSSNTTVDGCAADTETLNKHLEKHSCGAAGRFRATHCGRDDMSWPCGSLRLPHWTVTAVAAGSYWDVAVVGGRAAPVAMGWSTAHLFFVTVALSTVSAVSVVSPRGGGHASPAICCCKPRAVRLLPALGNPLNECISKNNNKE